LPRPGRLSYALPAPTVYRKALHIRMFFVGKLYILLECFILERLRLRKAIAGCFFRILESF
ncbi:MAG: hypothetical protein NC412_11015, partial [Roseburia sp.]|nr:hypothetical protein [Roseburia sp.]